MRRLVCGTAAAIGVFLAFDRTLILAVLLWRLRKQHPEMFDGAAAVATINNIIATEGR